ncbi:MAG: hypothetical protein ACOCZE_08580, partial [Planctomycetota bacterium]
MNRRTITILILVAAGALLAGCEQDTPEAADRSKADPIRLTSDGSDPKVQLRPTLGAGTWPMRFSLSRQTEMVVDANSPIVSRFLVEGDYTVEVQEQADAPTRAVLRFQRVRITLTDFFRSGREDTKVYDTDKPTEVPELYPAWSKLGEILLSASYTYVLDEQGRILDIEGLDAVLDDLPVEIGMDMQSALTAMSADSKTGELVARQLILGGWASNMPDAPVGSGAEWTLTSRHRLPGVPASDLEMRYKADLQEDLRLDESMSYELGEKIQRGPDAPVLETAEYEQAGLRFHRISDGWPVRLE